MNEEQLTKERDFYKKRYNEVGSKVFRLSEDLSRSYGDMLRAQTAASLIRDGYHASTFEDLIEDVALKFLKVVLEKLNVDSAMLLRETAQGASLELFAQLGTEPAERDFTLPCEGLPEFLLTRNSKDSLDSHQQRLVGLLGRPYVLWAFSPTEKLALLVGKDTEDERLRPAFDSKDRNIIEGALGVFIDLYRRKEAEARLAALNVYLQDLADSFARFVPRDFLRHLERKSIMDVRLGDQISSTMTVLFCDVRKFTSLSETLGADELFELLNSYLGAVVPPVRANNGFVDKYIGDAIMALFPDAAGAIQGASQMLQALAGFNEGRARPLKIGIGLHTGPLIMGTLGDPESLQCTVIADAVNLASRIEGLTKYFGCNLLVSEYTLAQSELAGKISTRTLGQVQVKGKTEGITLFHVFDAEPAERKAEILASLPAYLAGISAWQSGDFKLAQAAFEEAGAQAPSDQLIAVYISQCIQALERGISKGWRGVLEVTEK